MNGNGKLENKDSEADEVLIIIQFTLTEEEDFWPIIAEREAAANMHRRASLMGQGGLSGLSGSGPIGSSSSGSVHNEESVRQMGQTAMLGTEKMENIVVL